MMKKKQTTFLSQSRALKHEHVERKPVTIRKPLVRRADVSLTKRTIHRVANFLGAAVVLRRGFVDKVVN